MTRGTGKIANEAPPTTGTIDNDLRLDQLEAQVAALELGEGGGGGDPFDPDLLIAGSGLNKEVVGDTVTLSAQAVPASEVAVADLDGYFVGETDEEVLQEVGLALGNTVRKTGGGGRDIHTHEDVSGAVVLDLADGSVQRIEGSTGAFTLAVTNGSPTGEQDWLLIIVASHEPTFPDGTEFPNGLAPIDWDGVTPHYFAMNSTNGGTTTKAWHLTPAPRVQFVIFQISGVLTVGDRTLFPLPNLSGIERNIVGLAGRLAVASATGPATFTLFVDGNEVFTDPGNRLAIAQDATSGITEDIDVSSWPHDSELTVGVDDADGVAASALLMVLYTEVA